MIRLRFIMLLKDGNMKRLQVEEVRRASIELEELTNIFVNWGNDLNDRQQVVEHLSTYELGELTRKNTEITGKDRNITYDSIYDDFSLSELFKSLIMKP